MDATATENQSLTTANTIASVTTSMIDSADIVQLSATNLIKNKRKNFNPRYSAVSDEISEQQQQEQQQQAQQQQHQQQQLRPFSRESLSAAAITPMATTVAAAVATETSPTPVTAEMPVSLAVSAITFTGRNALSNMPAIPAESTIRNQMMVAHNSHSASKIKDESNGLAQGITVRPQSQLQPSFPTQSQPLASPRTIATIGKSTSGAIVSASTATSVAGDSPTALPILPPSFEFDSMEINWRKLLEGHHRRAGAASAPTATISPLAHHQHLMHQQQQHLLLQSHALDHPSFSEASAVAVAAAAAAAIAGKNPTLNAHTPFYEASNKNLTIGKSSFYEQYSQEPQAKLEFAYNAFNAVEELLNVYGLSISPNDIVDAFKKQTVGRCPGVQPPTPPRTPTSSSAVTTSGAGSVSSSAAGSAEATGLALVTKPKRQHATTTVASREADCMDGQSAVKDESSDHDDNVPIDDKDKTETNNNTNNNKEANPNSSWHWSRNTRRTRSIANKSTEYYGKNTSANGRCEDGRNCGEDSSEDDDADRDGEYPRPDSASDRVGDKDRPCTDDNNPSTDIPKTSPTPLSTDRTSTPLITLAPVSKLMQNLPSPSMSIVSSLQQSLSISEGNPSGSGCHSTTAQEQAYRSRLGSMNDDVDDATTIDADACNHQHRQQNDTLDPDSDGDPQIPDVRHRRSQQHSSSASLHHNQHEEQQHHYHRLRPHYLQQHQQQSEACSLDAEGSNYSDDADDSLPQAFDLSRYNDDSNASIEDHQSDDQEGSDDIGGGSTTSMDYDSPRLAIKNTESLLDKCALNFFSPILQLAQMQNEDKQMHAESVKNLTKFSSYTECKNNQCQLENLREHYHCYDRPCMGKILSKKEEIIRHLKWHKKRSESLNHGFLRFSSSDDCSTIFHGNCTHNRKQTHYHCIQQNCGKVYISTSDVQMHSNYHRKDSAIYQEGFQRYRATEECNADYCMFSGQRTTHFHCRRNNCRYTFKNKADMEKHKSYHIKDLELARDGFKKFLKTEACPYTGCRFSKICNHIHCVRENCCYVLHSSGQLLSHKRKHERMDSEQAYRRFKMVHKAAVAGILGQDLSQFGKSSEFSSKPSTPSSSSTAISPELQITGAAGTAPGGHGSGILTSDLAMSFPAAAKQNTDAMNKMQSNPVDLSLLCGNTGFSVEILQQIQKRQQQLWQQQAAAKLNEDVSSGVAGMGNVAPSSSSPTSSFNIKCDNGEMKPFPQLYAQPMELGEDNILKSMVQNSSLGLGLGIGLGLGVNAGVDEIEQMIRQYFTENCTRQASGPSNESQLQTEPLNLHLKNSIDSAKACQTETSSRSAANNPRIECFMSTNESHLHCLIKGCEAVVPRSLADITEHMRMHELTRNAESIMQSSNLLQITSIEGFFNRKRGRPPKNRVVEVYNNAQQSPQAIFTSFKLEKNINEHSPTSLPQNPMQRIVASSASTSMAVSSITSMPSASPSTTLSSMANSTIVGGCQYTNTTKVDNILGYLSDKKFRIYQENEKCCEQYCALVHQLHFHCMSVSHCHFATTTGRSMDNHMQEFHNNQNANVFDNCEFFDRAIDCQTVGCAQNRVCSHFHCLKCGQSVLSQNDLQLHLCTCSNHNGGGRDTKDAGNFNANNPDEPSSAAVAAAAQILSTMFNNSNSHNANGSMANSLNSATGSKNSSNVDYQSDQQQQQAQFQSHPTPSHTPASVNFSSGLGSLHPADMSVGPNDSTLNESCYNTSGGGGANNSGSSGNGAISGADKSNDDVELDYNLVKSDSSEDEKVSVVRAAGTYFPQNSNNADISTSGTVPTTPTLNSSSSLTHTSQSCSDSMSMCQRPFCKLKKKLHQHCELCNQAFSDNMKLKFHRMKHSTTRLGQSVDAEAQQNQRADREGGQSKLEGNATSSGPNGSSSTSGSQDEQPQDLTKMMQQSPTTSSAAAAVAAAAAAASPLQQMLPQNFVENLSMQNMRLAQLALYQQNPLYYQNYYPLLASQGLPLNQARELLQSQFDQPMISNKCVIKSEPPSIMAYPFVEAAVAAAAAAAAASAAGGVGGGQFELPKVPAEMFGSFKQKRKSSDDYGQLELPSKKLLKTNRQNNFKIFKDEPIPHGYLKFRFNEDCNFANCGYRNHQSHFHCCRNDCYYSFCDKTRFVQHTARHERLDKLMGDDFKQYRANMRCGYEECAYSKNMGTGQNNKSSHFHCLKCSFICSDTNKVVAHRRQHSKMEYIRMAGFRKVANNEKCTINDQEPSNGECTYSLKQTHYHCLICDCSVLSRAQLGSHRHRVQ